MGEWRRRHSLLALLVFPLGMAVGALLSGFLGALFNPRNPRGAGLGFGHRRPTAAGLFPHLGECVH